MKKFLLISAVALLTGCSTETAQLDPDVCLANSDDPLMVVDNRPFHDGVGQFEMTGEVQSSKEIAPFSEEEVDIVYLVLPDDGSSAFDYFYELAGEQKIDKIAREELYLKLGVLEEEEALVSSAYMNTATQEKILSALNSGDEITLNMLIASELGQGATVSSVHPCLIE